MITSEFVQGVFGGAESQLTKHDKDCQCIPSINCLEGLALAFVNNKHCSSFTEITLLQFQQV